MAAVDAVAEEDYSQLYGELPGNLIEEILVWFPAEYLRRFATVCKQWNALFSSTNFFSKQWAEAPPNKNPWLLVGGVGTKQDFWAYSSFTRSWKNYRLPVRFLDGVRVPLNFSWRDYRLSLRSLEGAPPISILIFSSFHYLVSGAGLFLIKCTSPDSIYVGNPLTGKYFTLPPMEDMDNFSIDEIGIVEEGKDGYKVLVVHYSNVREQRIVEIYDSTDKAWTIAGLLPRYLMAFEEDNLMRPGTVFSGGYFYCLMLVGEDDDRDDFTGGIMDFNMVCKTSIFVALPELIHKGFNYFNQLVHCGSRILFVEGRKSQSTHEEEVIIWEFNKDADTNWNVIGRMPPTLHPSFSSYTRFRCVAMGDCLYFKNYRKMEVVVYNLTHNSWTFLPNCPIGEITGDQSVNAFVAFTPKPDMKVE